MIECFRQSPASTKSYSSGRKYFWTLQYEVFCSVTDLMSVTTRVKLRKAAINFLLNVVLTSPRLFFGPS